MMGIWCCCSICKHFYWTSSHNIMPMLKPKKNKFGYSTFLQMHFIVHLCRLKTNDELKLLGCYSVGLNHKVELLWHVPASILSACLSAKLWASCQTWSGTQWGRRGFLSHSLTFLLIIQVTSSWCEASKCDQKERHQHYVSVDWKYKLSP